MSKAFALLITFFTVLTLAACGGGEIDGTPSKLDEPLRVADFSGTWNMATTVSNVSLEATIGDGVIDIVFLDLDSTGRTLYWSGTFTDSNVQGASITSIGNIDKMAGSVMGSSMAEKIFSVEDRLLRFDLQMMGTARVIYLEKTV